MCGVVGFCGVEFGFGLWGEVTLATISRGRLLGQFDYFECVA